MILAEQRSPLAWRGCFPSLNCTTKCCEASGRRRESLIAHNAIHAGFVAGGGVCPTDVRGEPSLAISADDRLLDGCAGPALMETIGSSLKWLTDLMRDRGDRLGAGQIVLTGSIPSLIPIGENCQIKVDAPPLGSVEVEVDRLTLRLERGASQLESHASLIACRFASDAKASVD